MKKKLASPKKATLVELRKLISEGENISETRSERNELHNLRMWKKKLQEKI